MSLTVSPDLLDQARHGDIDDAAFTACIQTSLPYAWQVITGLTERMRAAAQTWPTTTSRRRMRHHAGSSCG